jgi:four helix bundle protein
MTMNDLRERTTVFALRVVALVEALPRSLIGRVMGAQVLRAGTSVGAQYREACRSRSTAEMISKVESTLQELDETDYWLDLIARRKLVRPSRLTSLRREADELTRILVASVKKMKQRKR